MSEIITTLHKKDDATVDVYPNIKGDNIPSGAVTTAKINDGAVTEDKIADGAVTEDIIANESITTAKMNFHLYEHNINIFNTATIENSDLVCSFRLLSTDPTPYTKDNVDEIANLLYSRGINGIGNMLTASGRCYEDSFRVITELDFAEQSDDNDYCETIIVGVYGDNADTLYYVYNTLSENETTKLLSKEYEAQVLNDVVVTLF